jgi:uncharacterized protein YjbJ (UPF0337 family)
MEAIMNTNQINGRVSQACGKVKEFFGRLFGNKQLEGKGYVEKTSGKIEAGYGDLKSDVRKNS